MRPFHLWIAVLLLAAALFGLWRFVAPAAPGEIRAAGLSPLDPEAEREAGALAAQVAREPGEERAAASPGTRSAAVAPSSEPVASAAASPREPPLVGRVLDGEGAPVPGASVFVAGPSHWMRLPLDIELDGLPRNWLELEVATTDEHGRYAFEDVEDLADHDELRLAVRAAGFAPLRRDRVRPRLEDGRRVLEDARLAAGGVCSGRVVDAKGEGVAGARIVQAIDGGNALGGLVLNGRGILLGETRADGSFRVDQLASGPFELAFDASGFRLAERSGRIEPGVELGGWIVALEYGDSIVGRVEAAAGARALTAEELALLRISARPAQPERGAPVESAGAQDDAARARHGLLDAEGAFRVDGLVPGASYRLTAWELDPESGRWSRLDAVQSVVARAGDRSVRLEHRPLSELAFRVLDDASGLPIEEFGVWVGVGRKQVLRDAERVPRTHHPDGRATCPDLRLRAGGPRLELAVVAQGYEPYEAKDLAVEPGGVRDLGELRLKPAPELRVRVVADESGEPLAGARVALSTLGEQELDPRQLRGWLARSDDPVYHRPEVACARTDAQGWAVLSARKASDGALVAFARGRVASQPVRVPLPAQGSTEHELRLARGGTVIVRVADEAGQPVEGVQVVHRAPDEREDEFDGDEGERSDARGEIRYEALEPGVHGFLVVDAALSEVWLDGEDEGREPVFTEVVVAGTGEVVLALFAPPRGSLEGVVREEGRLLEGATLQLVPRPDEGEESGAHYSLVGADSPLTATSDERGAYRFEDVAAGRYWLLVGHATRRMAERIEATVTKDTARLDVDLAVTRIAGRIVDATGQPLAGIEVRVSDAGQHQQMQPMQMVVVEDDRGSLQVRYDQRATAVDQSDADGSYELRGVSGGTALMVSTRGDYVLDARAGPLELVHGEARRGVDFELQAAGAVALELRGEPRDGVMGWYRVRLTRQGEEDGQRQPTSSAVLSTWQRRRVVGSLRPGRWVIELSDRQRSPQSVQQREVEIEAGRVQTLVFEL